MNAASDHWLVRAATWLSHRWLPILAAWLVVLFLLFVPSLRLKLFADDFHSWRTVTQLADRPIADLLLRTYNPEFYRPLEFALILLNVSTAGLDPIVYRLATVIGHLLTCMAILLLCVRLGFGRVAGTASAILFGIHQTNAMAVLSNDAASQVFMTLFGLLALCALLPAGGRLAARHVVAACVFLALSLLWKDSGTGFVVAAMLLVIVDRWPVDGGRRALVAIVAMAVVFFAYLWLRSRSGVIPPVFGYRTRYELWAGWNLLANPVMMLLSMITPVGSTIVLLRLRRVAFMAATAVSIAFVAAGLVIGLVYFYRRFPEHRRRLMLLAAIFVILFYPDALMVHVSELYTYKPNAIFCVFLGIGVLDVYHWAIERRRAVLSGLLAGLIVALFACHALSIKHKEWLMRNNAEVAELFLKTMRHEAPMIGPGTAVVLTNAHAGPAPNYSVFYMEGVHVLGGPQVLELVYGVKPRSYDVVDEARVDATCRARGGECLTIRYDRGAIDVGLRRPGS